MRHVSRTHRVALDRLFDRIFLDSKIQIKYIDTKNQLADILTKGNFTRDECNHLLNLCNINHFSSTACTAAMTKRAQQEFGEERVTPMMNLTARMPSVVSFSTSSNPGRTWCQDPGKFAAVDDRSRKPDKPSPTCYSKKMVDLDLLKSGKVWLRRTIDQGHLKKLFGMRYNKVSFIMKNLFSTEMHNPCCTEKQFMMDWGNLTALTTKKMQNRKLPSWEVTHQNL